MDPEKVIICRCENVTLKDILDAIDKGYTDLESLKRYLRIGMGPCQGKYCLVLTASILRRRLGKSYDELLLPKNRPPLKPIEAYYFLKQPKDTEDLEV